MSFILDIATAVPPYAVSKKELADFYTRALEAAGMDPIPRKINWVIQKAKINNRYSCIPDFKGERNVLFVNGGVPPTIEARTEVYKNNILLLATKAVDQCFENKIKPKDVTHLITVSCTGVFAPGLEFLLAEYYGMQQAEKMALNFLGCYAAIKALAQANYITKAYPSACVLVVCAELCSLHFQPYTEDEQLVTNLLFADGAAAVVVCGEDSMHIENQTVLQIDSIQSKYIPDTFHLMSWNVSSTAFYMHLSKHIAEAVRVSINPVVKQFLSQADCEPAYWAIHPGGVSIVEAVREALHLYDEDVRDSLAVLENYGNMSSPTILFVLKRIFEKIEEDYHSDAQKVFACALGPGINLEMINFTIVQAVSESRLKGTTRAYANLE